MDRLQRNYTEKTNLKTLHNVNELFHLYNILELTELQSGRIGVREGREGGGCVCKRALRHPCHGTVLCLDSGGGHTNLHT